MEEYKLECYAIGIGIYNGFATVWFGEEIDPKGEPERKIK